MKWTKPEYGKKRVGRAGDTLIQEFSNEKDYSEALDILSNWRSSHALPLMTIQALLRRKTGKINKESIVSQRLKRTPSIIKKLRRFPNMRLQRMQDIGGCRAIVPKANDVYQLKDCLTGSKTQHCFKSEKNYIKNPKISGYRGIHLICQYQSNNHLEYNGHNIEIQLRTSIQHAWATAVEITGMFLKQSLKSGEGSEEWLSFFQKISILFARLEGFSLSGIENFGRIKREAINLEIDLKVIERFQSFSVTTNLIGNQEKKSGYFLFFLNLYEQNIEIKSYKNSELSLATNDYMELEKQYQNDDDIDIVLISIKSVQNLQRAYPNYFANSKTFLKILERVLYDRY